jgi:hypothetical protein
MKTYLSDDQRTLTIEHVGTVIPTQISVINTFPKGYGDVIVERGFAQQEKHDNYLLEYNEPSAKIFDASFKKADPTVMYTFGTGKEDLVFHRHAGRRAITGITGSEGALLKFSHTTSEEMEKNPNVFFDNMVYVYLPADSQFMLKFDGNTYHQFGPLHKDHNAFFAVSVHPQEDQNLSGELLEKVHNGEASIPILTEPVPGHIIELLATENVREHIHKVHLMPIV